MNEGVIIKSLPHGISLILSENMPIEDLLTEICYKFASSRKFFGAAEFVLSIEGRSLTEEETEAVIQSIEYNSDIRISVVSTKDRASDNHLIALKKKEEEKYIDYNAKIIFDISEYPEEAFFDTSVVVLGNIPEEYSIKSVGNIIATGAIYGGCFAGYPARRNCVIAAGIIDSIDLAIGGIAYTSENEKRGFFKRKNSKKGAKVLYLDGHEVVMDDFGEIDIIKHISGKA